MALQISQSIVLGYIAHYFTIDNPSDQETREAYLWAAGTHTHTHTHTLYPPPPLSWCAGLVGMALIITVIHGHGFLLGQKIGMMSRVMCTNAIYQKVRLYMYDTKY